jgi:hypothetical protein
MIDVGGQRTLIDKKCNSHKELIKTVRKFITGFIINDYVMEIIKRNNHSQSQYKVTK